MIIAQMRTNSMKIILATVIFLINVLYTSYSSKFKGWRVKNIRMIALEITSSKVKMANSTSRELHNAA